MFRQTKNWANALRPVPDPRFLEPGERMAWKRGANSILITGAKALNQPKLYIFHINSIDFQKYTFTRYNGLNILWKLNEFGKI